jgi:hypothetical protein
MLGVVTRKREQRLGRQEQQMSLDLMSGIWPLHSPGGICLMGLRLEADTNHE